MNTAETIHETLTFSLPAEILEDLEQIARFDDTTVEKLVYSYIIEGIANNSRAVNRMKFTDKANEKLVRNNAPPKSVEDIFNNLVY